MGPRECRGYRERNDVASFENEDENSNEISKKLTRPLDNVTSDYHSGSSLSEETSRQVEVKPSSVTATLHFTTDIPASSNVAPFAQRKARNVLREWPSESVPFSYSICYPNQERKNKPFITQIQ